MAKQNLIRLFVILTIGIWILLVLIYTLPDKQGTDFFPLRAGLDAILTNKSPYSPEVSNYIHSHWQTAQNTHVASVVAYLLPSLIPLLPFAFVPEPAMTIVWMAFLFSALIFAVWHTRRDITDIALPFFFYPVFHAMRLKTSSVLWFAVLLLSLFNTRKLSPAVYGACTAYLPLKPQTGLFFSLFSLARMYKVNRTSLIYVIAFTIVLWGTSFILFPDWISQWINALGLYRSQVQTIPSLFQFMPIAILGIGVLPTIAIIPIISIAVFPLNDLYCSLPLLIFWRSFRPSVAFIGCGFSFLGPLLFESANSSSAIYSVIAGPLLIITLLSRNKELRQKLFRKEIDFLA